MLSNSFKWKHFVGEIIGSVAKNLQYAASSVNPNYSVPLTTIIEF